MSRDRLGSVWPGRTFIGPGVMLLPGQWLGWGQLWPLFPLLGGLSFLVAWALGAVALVVGIAGLGITFGVLGKEVVKLWPLLLILIGLFGLASGVIRILRRG